MNRRTFLAAAGAGTLTAAPAAFAESRTGRRPNVILILTDDQGYGDMSCHGNPVLQTPNIDRLHAESIRFTDFHAAPMCSPTRGQLLTGLDAIRNGATATCLGRSTIREGLPTLGDAFASSGYRTGLFGKWHVGYSYPFRPMDRGFQDCVYFQGYGLTGMGHHWASDYFDPFYYRNGKLQHANGFCTDFWMDEAMGWMEQRRKRREPFFCYLPLNAPHFPMWVHEKYSKPYEGRGPAGFYGLIANLDENLGRLEAFLRRSGLRDDTIVLFMTDNGTVEWKQFNAGMSQGKTSLLEGGHRVPCFVRWPNGRLRAPGDVGTPAQVQDILPTLIDLCGLKRPDTRFDGASLAPLLRGDGSIADRMLVVQYYQSFIRKGHAAVAWNKWRLVRDKELYDVRNDPAQKQDVASPHPEVVAKMRDYYERWWQDAEPLVNRFVPAHIGSPKEEEVMLCSSEWQDVRADGQATARNAQGGPKGGPWNVEVERGGRYRIELCRWPREANAALNAGLPEFKPRFGAPEPPGKALPIARAALSAAGRDLSIGTAADQQAAVFETDLSEGRTQMHGWFQDSAGADLCGAYYAYVKRV